MFGVQRSTFAARLLIDHEHEHEQECRLSSAKKYRPPRPMDVKGGCSPQNTLEKLACYYLTLSTKATKF
jgi:hypothetical protein